LFGDFLAIKYRQVINGAGHTANAYLRFFRRFETRFSKLFEHVNMHEGDAFRTTPSVD
jgi:hypothetical protein